MYVKSLLAQERTVFRWIKGVKFARVSKEAKRMPQQKHDWEEDE